MLQNIVSAQKTIEQGSNIGISVDAPIDFYLLLETFTEWVVY